MSVRNIKKQILEIIDFTSQEIDDFDNFFILKSFPIQKIHPSMPSQVTILYSRENPNQDFNMFFYNSQGPQKGLSAVNSEELLNLLYKVGPLQAMPILEAINVNDKIMELVLKREVENKARLESSPEFQEAYMLGIKNALDEMVNKANEHVHINFKMLGLSEEASSQGENYSDKSLFLMGKMKDKLTFLLGLEAQKTNSKQTYTVLIQPMLSQDYESKNSIINHKKNLGMGAIASEDWMGDYDSMQGCYENIYYNYVTIIPESSPKDMRVVQMPINIMVPGLEAELLDEIKYLSNYDSSAKEVSERIINSFRLLNSLELDAFIGKSEIEQLVYYKKNYLYTNEKVKNLFNNVSLQTDIYLEKFDLIKGLENSIEQKLKKVNIQSNVNVMSQGDNSIIPISGKNKI